MGDFRAIITAIWAIFFTRFFAAIFFSASKRIAATRCGYLLILIFLYNEPLEPGKLRDR